MALYRATADTDTRLTYGVELAAGLTIFEETEPLVPVVEEANAELKTTKNNTDTAEDALTKARAYMRGGDYKINQAIRSLALAAKRTDGGQPGPIFKRLFPNNLTPVVIPKREKQRKPLQDLLQRLSDLKGVPKAKDFKDAELPIMQAATAAFETCLQNYLSKRKAAHSAFVSELGERDEHLVTMDSVHGGVRSIFPRDRAKQKVIFPERRRTRKNKPSSAK